jgi:LPXTG-site transpeptidase (sortase) family protein
MTILKNLSKRNILIIIIIFCIILLNVALYIIPKKSVVKKTISHLPAATKMIKNNYPGFPIRLKIPSINIDVPIEYVGVTKSGTMDIPKNTDDVGWFQLGKRPGEIGNAVIAGHYGLYAGKPSVFDNIHDLKIGDEIFIEDDKGATISFVVRESRSFNPDADATIVFSSDDEKSHLNLITCEGTWNKDVKSYSQRLVVFTDKK